MRPTVSQPWMLACRQVLVDQLRGDLSIIDVLDSVVVARVPSIHLGFALVARFTRSAAAPERESLSVRFVRQDGEVRSAVAETSAVIEPGSQGAWAFVMFKVLRADAFGPLVFETEWRSGTGRWRRGSSVTIRVLPIAAEEPLLREISTLLDALPPLG